jgi:uncharacterized protein
MTPASHSKIRAAWREPMAYLIWGLPLLCVLAFVAMLSLATPHSNEFETVQRMAQIQTSDDHADRAALALGMRATLRRLTSQSRMDPAKQEGVELNLMHDSALEIPSLALVLIHPTRASHDRWMPLVRVTSAQGGSIWHSADVTFAGEMIRWRVQLLPQVRDCSSAQACASVAPWRLHGRMQGDEETVLLPRYAGGAQ